MTILEEIMNDNGLTIPSLNESFCLDGLKNLLAKKTREFKDFVIESNRRVLEAEKEDIKANKNHYIEDFITQQREISEEYEIEQDQLIIDKKFVDADDIMNQSTLMLKNLQHNNSLFENILKLNNENNNSSYSENDNIDDTCGNYKIPEANEEHEEMESLSQDDRSKAVPDPLAYEKNEKFLIKIAAEKPIEKKNYLENTSNTKEGVLQADKEFEGYTEKNSNGSNNSLCSYDSNNGPVDDNDESPKDKDKTEHPEKPENEPAENINNITTGNAKYLELIEMLTKLDKRKNNIQEDLNYAIDRIKEFRMDETRKTNLIQDILKMKENSCKKIGDLKEELNEAINKTLIIQEETHTEAAEYDLDCLQPNKQINIEILSQKKNSEISQNVNFTTNKLTELGDCQENNPGSNDKAVEQVYIQNFNSKEDSNNQKNLADKTCENNKEGKIVLSLQSNQVEFTTSKIERVPEVNIEILNMNSNTNYRSNLLKDNIYNNNNTNSNSHNINNNYKNKSPETDININIKCNNSRNHKGFTLDKHGEFFSSLKNSCKNNINNIPYNPNNLLCEEFDKQPEQLFERNNSLDVSAAPNPNPLNYLKEKVYSEIFGTKNSPDYVSNNNSNSSHHFNNSYNSNNNTKGNNNVNINININKITELAEQGIKKSSKIFDIKKYRNMDKNIFANNFSSQAQANGNIEFNNNISKIPYDDSHKKIPDQRACLLLSDNMCDNLKQKDQEANIFISQSKQNNININTNFNRIINIQNNNANNFNINNVKSLNKVNNHNQLSNAKDSSRNNNNSINNSLNASAESNGNPRNFIEEKIPTSVPLSTSFLTKFKLQKNFMFRGLGYNANNINKKGICNIPVKNDNQEIKDANYYNIDNNEEVKQISTNTALQSNKLYKGEKGEHESVVEKNNTKITQHFNQLKNDEEETLFAMANILTPSQNEDDGLHSTKQQTHSQPFVQSFTNSIELEDRKNKDKVIEDLFSQLQQFSDKIPQLNNLIETYKDKLHVNQKKNDSNNFEAIESPRFRPKRNEKGSDEFRGFKSPRKTGFLLKTIADDKNDNRINIHEDSLSSHNTSDLINDCTNNISKDSKKTEEIISHLEVKAEKVNYIINYNIYFDYLIINFIYFQLFENYFRKDKSDIKNIIHDNKKLKNNINIKKYRNSKDCFI